MRTAQIGIRFFLVNQERATDWGAIMAGCGDRDDAHTLDRVPRGAATTRQGHRHARAQRLTALEGAIDPNMKEGGS